MNNDEDSFGTPVAESLPFEVVVEPHVRVELSSGVVISLRLWLPVGGPGERFPAVLEAMPYRKDDNSLVDDSARFGFIAGHGYVGVRMDLRGSGTSTGVLEDEYSEQEQLDICEVIDWISRQPWCTGAVAMTGISWSGFNSLQVAARRPPALRTVISVCSTDDRYDNDVHYMGGSLLAFYQAMWGATMHANNSHPPDPAVVGDAWKELWLARLHHNPHQAALFTQHQRRDGYWRQGSVCEDYAAITVPALLVGGWQDPYTDAVFRLVAALGPDSRALVGPWAHTWPERPVPGPAIGYLQECVRWLDHWLKGVDNGVDADPRIRFHLQDSAPADAFVRERAGRWLGADAVPSGPDGPTAVLWPHPGGGLASSAATGTASHSSPLLLGRGARHFEPMGGLGDLPDVQTRDDADALGFTTEPLAEELALFGQVVVRLRLASDRPEAFVFARLTDVDEDGESYLVTRGNLNLTHRLGHDTEVAAVPVGELLDHEIPLKHVAQVVPAGHRLRISLSTSYWPWIWPSPERATITLDLAGCSVTLPLLDPSAATPLARPWEAPLIAPPARVAVEGGETAWSWHEDGGRVVRSSAPCTKRYPSGLTTVHANEARFLLDPDDPLSATVEHTRTASFAREGWHVATALESRMTCDATTFTLRTRMTATLDGAEVFAEDVTHTIPRDHT